MSKFKLPTEVLDLPSKGLLYPKEHPLSSGKVEIKYMTAKEEDILSNAAYIQKGTVIDKLLESLLVTKVKLDDFLVGDKNAVMIAARVLGYGKDYTFTYNGKEETVDLSKLEHIPIDEDKFKNGNEFDYVFPHSKTRITFKLINGADEKKIQREVEGLQRINKDADPSLSTRLKHIITSVEGDRDAKTIRDFVDNFLLARDSREFRLYVKAFSPDVDLTFFPLGEEVKRSIPIGLSLFWPDSE